MSSASTTSGLTESEQHLLDSMQAYHHQMLVERLRRRANEAGWGLLELQDGSFLAGNSGQVVKLRHTIDVGVFLELLDIPATTEH